MTSSAIARILRQRRPFASVQQEVFLALQVAAQRVAEPWAHYLKMHGKLTSNQYNVLRILRGAGDRTMTCGEVAERMIARDPDVTRVIDRLVKNGFVERHADADDRRVVRMRITDEGRAALRTLDHAARTVPFERLRHLNAEQLSALRDLLNLVLAPDASGDDHTTHSSTT